MVAPRRIACGIAALTLASACGTAPTETRLPELHAPTTTSSTTSTWTYTPPTSTTEVTTQPQQVVDPPAPKTSARTTPKTTTQAPAAYYANCSAAKAARAAPLYRGQPGYRSGLDRDGDGVACER